VPQALGIALNLVQQSFLPDLTAPVSRDPAAALKQMGPMMGAYAVSLCVVLLAHLVIYTVALGATTHALSEVHLGRTISIAGGYNSLRGSMGGLFRLMLLWILIGFGAYGLAGLGAGLAAIMVAVGMRAAIGSNPLVAVGSGLVFVLLVLIASVPASILLMRYSVSVPALVLEKLGARQALRRSAQLTKAYVGRIFLIVVLMYLITLIVASIFQIPFWVAGAMMGYRFGIMPFWLRVPWVLAAGAAGALSGPFLMIALALAYYDARVRKEGFDLQLMIASLDGAGPTIERVQPAPPAAP
jgi:hypothetical protein